MSFLFTQEEVTEMRIQSERREQAEETARKMLLDGEISLTKTAEYTNLPLDEVKKLKSELLQDA